jgi:D-beta-D-heptose 7-phosphate kinase/D-beta-D-heptose 1-phosphate adenosyltransferase
MMSNKKNILVIGDVMLDEYIDGVCSRISPEAPVPVIRVKERRCVLGGAANVANNIAALGADVFLIGIIGDDDKGNTLSEIAQKQNIDAEFFRLKNRPTTVKTRITVGSHQMIRCDTEETSPLSEEDETDLIDLCRKHMADADIIIISDYNKGVCSEKLCKNVISSANAPVIIDPKQSDWSSYSGAYLIKPNLKEFTSAGAGEINDNDLPSKAMRLSEKYDIKNILITLSGDGMMLIGNGSVKNFETDSKEVYDVSGAGDTVIAALAVFLLSGKELSVAVRLANIAAGISVSKAGTSVVTLEEIYNKTNEKKTSKIKLREDLVPYVSELKKFGKKVVFTNGCFDVLHSGHISLLKQAKKFGDILIVGLNSDSSVKRLKGESRPINSEIERAEVLSAIEYVDAIVIFDEDTPYNLVGEILPDVIVKGGDYKKDEVVGGDIVKKAGGSIEIIPLISGKSTTGTIEKITNGAVNYE